jgi:hypothetical protein
MLLRTTLSLATALTLLTAPAFADSIDGNPIGPTDRQPRASVRGSPSILFEDRGVLGPLGTCKSDDGYADTRSCGPDGAI